MATSCRVVIMIVSTTGPNSLIVEKIKNCPNVLDAAKQSTWIKEVGFAFKKEIESMNPFVFQENEYV